MSCSSYQQFLDIEKTDWCGLTLYLERDQLYNSFCKSKKGKLVTVHAMKAYMGFMVVDSLIFNLNFTPRLLYLRENLVSLKFVLGLLERKRFLPLPEIERRIIQLVEFSEY
jgi:hypothetical protein